MPSIRRPVEYAAAAAAAYKLLFAKNTYITTMNTTASCILAAIIVLLILITAVMIHRHRASRGGFGDRTSRFMPGDAATSNLREAVALLARDLNCISRVSDSVEGQEKRIEISYGSINLEPAFNEAWQSLAGARSGIGEIVDSVNRLQAAVKKMPPTYQNVLSLYHGLRDSDKAFWEAAKSLDLAGGRMQTLIFSTDGHADALR